MTENAVKNDIQHYIPA